MAMQITPEVLSRITGKKINDNMRSIAAGLDRYGKQSGLDRPHRLAHYLAQLAHESGAFRYDGEIWGPTPAQKRYDTRTDLGNTKAADGDGEKYKGRGPIQITGKANYEDFRDWCRDKNLNPPDFVANPDMVNADPWEGLGPIWYWSTRNLNKHADANDIEMVTRRINGGVNGLADRLEWYTKVALVLAGYAPDAVKQFQADAKLTPVDGISGPKTRSALHMALAGMSAPSTLRNVTAAPVVDEVAVSPAGAEKTTALRVGGVLSFLSPIAAWGASAFTSLDQTGIFILIGMGVIGSGILLWRGELIAARAKAVIRSFGE